MAGRPPTKPAPPFGQRMAEARRALGMTQQQLAEKLDTTRKMIDYYERRAENVSADVLLKLSQILKLSTDELLGRTPQKAKPGPVSRIEQQMQNIKKLPKGEQKFLSDMIDRFMLQAKAS